MRSPHEKQPRLLALIFAPAGMRPAPTSATTGNASPLLARSVITLMLSCGESNTLDELPSHVSAHISSGRRIFSWLDGDQRAETTPVFVATNDYSTLGIGHFFVKLPVPR